MLKIKFKNGAIFTFDGQQGWSHVSGGPSDQKEILDQLWAEHYGAESAVYFLTVEGLHMRAILKLFDGKVIEDTREFPELNPDVDY